MIKATLDSNVWVSAFVAPRGLPGQIFDAWQDRKFTLVISEHIIKEVERIAEDKIKIKQNFVEYYISEFYRLAEVVEPALVYFPFLDEDDLPVLGTALAGRAEFLVTGDQQLLGLKKVNGIPIITPRNFLEIIR